MQKRGMKPLKKFRRRVADFFRARPALYDFARQARLRLLGPNSQIGRHLDRYARANFGNFTFLQIGASDGLRNDPVRDFVVRDRWSGVFVEPLPDVFPLLEKNYARIAVRGNLRFVNAAVSSRSASLPFYTFSKPFLSGKPLEERLHLLRKASFDRAQVMAFAGRGENIAVIEVPCLGIRDLLARHFPEGRLSLLALDVEGHEHEILSEIDFDAMRIGAVLFETWNLGDRRDAVFACLQNHGYRLEEAEGDALAIRQNP
jgi:FkbM family methyltransferase